MKRLFFALFAGAIASLVLAAGNASARQADPDATLDPGNMAAYVTNLLAPDVTIGNLDTTAAGTDGQVVGIANSLTDPSPPPGALFVDNTPLDGDCPQATYTTIQSAVNASGPNGTVIVCPGKYKEQVRIEGHSHDGLRLQSLKPLQAIIQWPTPTDTSPLALVDFNTADHVTLRGFVLTGPFPSTYVGDRHEGVLVENAFDERIDHNHVTRIEDVAPGRRGDQEGDAVSIGRRTACIPATLTCTGTGTEPGSARVDDNLIDEYQKNGIQAVNSGTFVEADHNVIDNAVGSTQSQPHAAPNGVVVFRRAAATIDHNEISNNRYTGAGVSSGGVLLFNTPTNSSEIDYNRIVGNDYAVETEMQAGLDISHNDVFQNGTGVNGTDAVILCCVQATGVVVRKNDVTDNGGGGILLEEASMNLLKSNHVENNGSAHPDAGIRADSDSTGNEILDNHMLNNLSVDCKDESSGTGTAGTANTWNGDKGQTSSPLGICDTR